MAKTAESNLQNPRRLFAEDAASALSAFDEGLASGLVTGRNRALGSLLNSERAVFYVQILYRLLLFRRDHELEPLHEDIYRACAPAQEAASGAPYPIEQFNIDVSQLEHWALVGKRLEKERIRGYKDSRRTKFRYHLPEETMAFLLWLEERLQDGLEDRSVDARDLLEEILGTIRELLRHLRGFKLWEASDPDPQSGESSDASLREADARRILFQIHKAHQITQDIGSSLAEFNARLLSFLTRSYSLGELRELLQALSTYVERYLRQVVRLRAELLPMLEKLARPRHHRRIQMAFEIMEQERRRSPLILRSRGDRLSPGHIPGRLVRFYTDEGVLDGLCRRINASALRVWTRMSAHLKELERKSHRLEDLKLRMGELSAASEDFVPVDWLESLLGFGHMRGDLHEWGEDQLADPPLPRRSSWRMRKSPETLLRPKRRGDGPVQSLEQTRLEELRRWLETVLLATGNVAPRLSEGRYRDENDGPQILQLAKAGILGRGRKLGSLGYHLEPLPEETTVTLGDAALALRDMELRAGRRNFP